jgi:hypothetical protein
VLEDRGSDGGWFAARASREEVAMRAPAFGLSTTPIMDIKTELRLQIERDMLALVYRTGR